MVLVTFVCKKCCQIGIIDVSATEKIEAQGKTSYTAIACQLCDQVIGFVGTKDIPPHLIGAIFGTDIPSLLANEIPVFYIQKSIKIASKEQGIKPMEVRWTE